MTESIQFLVYSSKKYTTFLWSQRVVSVDEERISVINYGRSNVCVRISLSLNNYIQFFATYRQHNSQRAILDIGLIPMSLLEIYRAQRHHNSRLQIQVVDSHTWLIKLIFECRSVWVNRLDHSYNNKTFGTHIPQWILWDWYSVSGLAII